jgi:hypothetical protein
VSSSCVFFPCVEGNTRLVIVNCSNTLLMPRWRGGPALTMDRSVVP